MKKAKYYSSLITQLPGSRGCFKCVHEINVCLGVRLLLVCLKQNYKWCDVKFTFNLDVRYWKYCFEYGKHFQSFKYLLDTKKFNIKRPN